MWYAVVWYIMVQYAFVACLDMVQYCMVCCGMVRYGMVPSRLLPVQMKNDRSQHCVAASSQACHQWDGDDINVVKRDINNQYIKTCQLMGIFRNLISANITE